LETEEQNTEADEGYSLLDEDTDGYEWAIERLREVANTLANHPDPERKINGPKHSLRVFNLINNLVDLIPAEDNKDEQ